LCIPAVAGVVVDQRTGGTNFFSLQHLTGQNERESSKGLTK